jgi:bifunctional non-homologous end joining protein LigD
MTEKKVMKLLPDQIVPMEPVQRELVDSSGRYLYQVKWDGVRELCFVTGSEVHIQNRRMNARTTTYPELHQLNKLLTASGVVVDGEVIAFGNRHRPSFQKVMKRDFVSKPSPLLLERIPIHYMIFDMLYCDGESWMHRPVEERLDKLKSVLTETEQIRISEFYEEGESLWESTRNLGLEGIVGKLQGSEYRPGEKLDHWIKLKHYRDMNCVVGGYTTKQGILNSLMIGAYDEENDLMFLGQIATGLSGQELSLLNHELPKMKVSQCPFVPPFRLPAQAAWVAPALTLKAKFIELTEEGQLRHPTVISFSNVKAKDCRMEGI